MKTRAAVVAAILSLASVTIASESRAALTSSEKAQLRDFVASARLDNAGRARTLVARTDHSEAESIAALAEAVAPVPFTPERAAFVREIVFGGASAPSRPLLAVATVKALLARADAVYQKYTGGLDHEPRAVGELFAIYYWLDSEIANAPKAAGIPLASYEAASKAMRDHLEANPRWTKGDGPIAEAAARVRAQAQILAFDLAPEGTTRNLDVAERLGLKGARRQMLVDWGILLEDAGKLDEAKAASVRSVLARLQGAREGLEVVYLAEDRIPLRARGAVAVVGTASGDAQPFDSDVAPAANADAKAAAIALDLSVLAARRALEKDKELRAQSERDAIAAHGDPKKVLGHPRGPGVDQVVGAALQLVVLDASRARDLAFMRVLDGRKESAALLSDALGVLASYGAGTIELGSTKLGLEDTKTPVTSFRLDGHEWTIDRSGANGAVTKVARDGAPVTLAHLSTARTPAHEGMSWTESGYVFTKLRGAPRVGLAPVAEKGAGVNVKLVGAGDKGFDGAGTAPSSQDYVVEGDVKVTGGPGGLAVRAVQGRDAVRGAVLVLTPGGRTTLATSDDAGNETGIGAPIDPTPAMPAHVKITVKGQTIEAVVGSSTLKGTLPATLSKGEIAVIAKKGATVEVTGFVVKQAAAAPAPKKR